jgi:hypothetical protein
MGYRPVRCVYCKTKPDFAGLIHAIFTQTEMGSIELATFFFTLLRPSKFSTNKEGALRWSAPMKWSIILFG